MRAYTALVFILIVLVGVFYAIYSLGFIGGVSQAPVQQTTTHFPPTAPIPTAADLVTAQQSFNYLVSYTVSGFHPTTLKMKTGETIRFTDNSPNQITIAGTGDASSTLQQGMYWQYIVKVTNPGIVTFTAGNSRLTVTVTK